MKVFCPFSTKPRSSGTAVLSMPPKASLPAEGSVSAQAPIFSKRKIGSA